MRYAAANSSDQFRFVDTWGACTHAKMLGGAWLAEAEEQTAAHCAAIRTEREAEAVRAAEEAAAADRTCGGTAEAMATKDAELGTGGTDSTLALTHYDNAAAKIYHIGDASVPVSMPQHYHHRGPHLRSLSYVIYCLVIEIVKTQKVLPPPPKPGAPPLKRPD